jgi:oligosaccharide repeat unit polymerase
MGYKQGKLPILAIHLFLAAFLPAVTLVYFSLRSESLDLMYPAAVLTLLMSVWWVFSWSKRAGKMFDPYFLFFLASMIFNCGQILLEVLGLNRGGILGGRFSNATVAESIFLIILCTHYLHLGALLGLPPGRRLIDTPVSPKDDSRKNAEVMRKIGGALWLVSVIPTIMVLKQSIAVVHAGGYFSLYEQTAVVGINAAPRLLSDFLIPASFFLLAGSKEKPALRFLAVTSVVIPSLIHLLLGERGTGAMPLVALAFVEHHCIRRFRPTFLLVAGVFLAFVIFPLLAVVRNVRLSERSNVSSLMLTMVTIDNPAVSIISEMGGSMLTVCHTLELVPKARDYDLGRSYGYAIFTLVPNLFWDLHPSKARGTLTDWLVKTVNPWTAKRGGSYGFSYIAEAYLNFGWFGAPLVMLALGFLLSRFSAWGFKGSDPAKIATLGVLLSFVLIFSRGESSGLMRPLFWCALAPYLMIYFLRRKARA